MKEIRKHLNTGNHVKQFFHQTMKIKTFQQVNESTFSAQVGTWKRKIPKELTITN